MSDDSRSDQELMINVQGLKKSYVMSHGIVEALRGVDLTLMKGESLAIMGPSGSGKSTLMHLLGCLDRPTEGSYFLNGQDVSKLDDHELSLLRSSQIGFVFQAFNLIPQFTIYENVALPYDYHIRNSTEGRNRIFEAIERVGLLSRIEHKPFQLSGGESQRVAIARALAIDPLLILADEPTGNLDSATGKEILTLFHELNNQGTTLVVVTHDESVGNQWDRLIRMRDGLVEKDVLDVIGMGLL